MSPCSDDEHHLGVGGSGGGIAIANLVGTLERGRTPNAASAAALASAAAAVVVGKQQLLESVPHVSLVPMQATSISSPERRIIAQKEIIAGEERPKYLLINNQTPPDVGPGMLTTETVDSINLVSFTFITHQAQSLWRHTLLA